MENRIKLLRLGSRCLLSLFQWPVFFQIYLVLFRKREKHPRRSVTFSEIAGKSLQRY